MANGPRYHVKFRRRREGRTDYRYRLGLLKSGETRAVVRKSLKGISVQLIDFDRKGDMVRASAIGKELAGFGWKHSASSTPAAYLTGLLAGIRAKKSTKSAVLDIGLNKSTKGSRIYASLKGLLDAGIEIPCDEEMIPSSDRISGGHMKGEVKSNLEEVKKKIMAEA